MRQDRGSTFDAAPVDRRGHRTENTLRLIQARDVLLMEAARHFPSDSDRATAKLLLDALKVYRNGRWQRDSVSEVCPPQYAGTFRLLFFVLLTLHDHLPCDRSIRTAVARARQ